MRLLSTAGLASAILAVAVLSSARSAAGQQQSGKPAVENPGWLEIALEHRTRYETLDNRFRLGETGSDQQIPQRTRLRFTFRRILGPAGFVMEFEDARIHLNDSGSTVNNSMADENDILQLYVSVPLKGVKSKHPSMLYIGRQSFDMGSRRLIARNRFRNATNAFDGVRWTLGDGNRWLLTAFAFQPVLRQMHRLDTRDHGAYFWGTNLSAGLRAGLKGELYYLGIHESRTPARSQNRRFSTIGTRLYRSPRAGTLSFEVETAWQVGMRGLLSQLAHFEHGSLDYSLDQRWRPMITGRYDYASGDRDPNDDTNGTFDTLYGARRFEWGPTGIYGAWARSNISSPGWAVALNPTHKLTFSPGMRWVWLARARDQWAGSGLRDATGRSGTYLGSQLEVRLSYDFSSHFRPEIGYVRLFKGSYLRQVPKSPGTGDSNYFYAEANFAFSRVVK